MNVSELLSHIDSEISTLRQVRTLLAGGAGQARPGRKPGRKHVMSAEGRARIAAAQRARWAKQKKAAKKAA
jgi:topoisomerase IA-like protein